MRRRHRVGAHGELRIADLGETRRQRQVLGVDRVDHIQRRQPLGLELERIDVDHDLAVLAAGRRRQRDAVDRRELLAQPVDAVIVELLLVERVGATGRSAAPERSTRCTGPRSAAGSRRHQGADRIGAGDDLRDREVEIDVGLEKDLLNRDAVERLRLDILDAVDARADSAYSL